MARGSQIVSALLRFWIILEGVVSVTMHGYYTILTHTR